jgi:hypothetical protein
MAVDKQERDVYAYLHDRAVYDTGDLKLVILHPIRLIPGVCYMTLTLRHQEANVYMLLGQRIRKLRQESNIVHDFRL